jgi:hypothetical protein
MGAAAEMLVKPSKRRVMQTCRTIRHLARIRPVLSGIRERNDWACARYPPFDVLSSLSWRVLSQHDLHAGQTFCGFLFFALAGDF